MLRRLRQTTEDRDQGFTLIELLVVMVIIGLLASIAVPVFLNQRKKAVDTSLKADLRSASIEVETFLTDNPTLLGPGTTTYTEVNTALNGGTAPTVANRKVKYDTSATTVQVRTNSVGYCLQAWATGSTSATTAATAWKYDSVAGGLILGKTPAAGTACA